MGIQLSDLVENIVGKEEIAHCFFSHNVSKSCLVDASKQVSMKQRIKIFCPKGTDIYFTDGNKGHKINFLKIINAVRNLRLSKCVVKIKFMMKQLGKKKKLSK